MTRDHEPTTRVAAGRAIVVMAGALLAAAVIWRLRPAADLGATPDAAVVAGCAWLAWALAGYLAVATAAVAIARLVGGAGRVGRTVRRLAPAQLRRAVEAVVTTGVAATIVGSTAAGVAVAAPSPVTVSERAPLVAGSPLDWPGLVVTAPTHRPERSRSGAGVVVAPGDTLWRIAARALGPRASGAAITEAWHAWYDTNRAVIGPDPSLIRPGQRLLAPDHQGVAR